MKKRILFYSSVGSLELFKTQKFYQIDIALLGDLGYDVWLCKLNCVMLYSHSISSVGERPAPRGGTTRPDECKITTI